MKTDNHKKMANTLEKLGELLTIEEGREACREIVRKHADILVERFRARKKSKQERETGVAHA